jgi:hypothetical protein
LRTVWRFGIISFGIMDQLRVLLFIPCGGATANQLASHELHAISLPFTAIQAAISCGALADTCKTWEYG